eukprot:22929_1
MDIDRRKQQTDLDYQMVTAGYIRSVIKLKTEDIPDVVIEICNKYIIPTKFETESADPLNFVSDNDKEISDKYKIEGNEYFKHKNYQSAITKYTTALRFNPRNHLIYCNRAYCYYLLSNYEDAVSDAKHCVNIRPTFGKGWFRYGSILEKQNKYGMAGVAYKTAYNLSINYNENQKHNKNPYSLYYTKFMKLLEDEDRLDSIKYINDFDMKSNVNWVDKFDAIADKFPQLKKFMQLSENEEIDEEEMLKFQQMMMQETELVQQKEEDDFRANAAQAKCNYFVQQNLFQFGVGNDEIWQISWSSTFQIDCNKRIICVNICDKQGVVVNNWLQHGVPNTNEYIYILFRAMAYTNLTKLRCIKPKYISIGYRMRNEFEAISKEMSKFGIVCVLQTKEQNEKACGENNTNIEGWNHLE